MPPPEPARDERTVAVENASYRLAYQVLTFGTLFAVAYRAYAWNQASWDLLALVLVAGAVTVGYQAVHRVLTPQALRLGAVAAVAAAAVALAVGLLR